MQSPLMTMPSMLELESFLGHHGWCWWGVGSKEEKNKSRAPSLSKPSGRGPVFEARRVRKLVNSNLSTRCLILGLSAAYSGGTSVFSGGCRTLFQNPSVFCFHSVPCTSDLDQNINAGGNKINTLRMGNGDRPRAMECRPPCKVCAKLHAAVQLLLERRARQNVVVPRSADLWFCGIDSDRRCS